MPDPAALPSHVKFVIIGAGVHGLSTAYHLALKLQATGKGGGRDILVVDKSRVAAGASGIACGVVRNNYFQPAMRELMAECVAVWESDPAAYHYNPVGYMQLSPEGMRADVASIAQQQREIGYDSVFIEGAADSNRYMKAIFDDWQAKGITSVLHEKKGGYANNRASMEGLADKARGSRRAHRRRCKGCRISHRIEFRRGDRRRYDGRTGFVRPRRRRCRTVGAGSLENAGLAADDRRACA